MSCERGTPVPIRNYHLELGVFGEKFGVQGLEFGVQDLGSGFKGFMG